MDEREDGPLYSPNEAAEEAIVMWACAVAFVAALAAALWG